MKKILLAVVALFSLVGCSADPEAKTAKEWVKEVLIEDYYVGDDEVVFRFEDNYQVYLGGENLGNWFKYNGDYFAFFSVEVIQIDGGIVKKYFAYIQWEDDGNIFNFMTKPEHRKISDEFLIGLEIEKQ